MDSLAEVGWYAVGSDDEDDGSIGLPGLCVLAASIGGHAALRS